jgi:hypothetical protein
MQQQRDKQRAQPRAEGADRLAAVEHLEWAENPELHGRSVGPEAFRERF